MKILTRAKKKKPRPDATDPASAPGTNLLPDQIVLTAHDLETDVVYKTNAYDAFLRINGNRPYDNITLLQLRKAMQRKPLIAPILVNEKMEIIDGQHRWFVSRELNLPLFFVMRPGYGHDQMVRYNINSKNWKMMDYLNLYVQRKYPDYVKLKEFIEQYELSLSAGIFLLTNRLTFTGGSRREVEAPHSELNTNKVRLIDKIFEEGKFRITIPDAVAHENGQRLHEIQTALLSVHFDAREYCHGDSFVRGFININRNPLYEHEKMMVKIDIMRPSYHHLIFDLARLPRRSEDYSLHLQKIYNHNNGRNITLYVPFRDRAKLKKKPSTADLFSHE